jgi:hypothetical protein
MKPPKEGLPHLQEYQKEVMEAFEKMYNYLLFLS